MKRELIMDIECYVDYFLVMFKAVDTKKVIPFEMYDGHPLDRVTIQSILKTYRIITFNGLHYDMPILSMALVGRSCAELKAATNAIIERGLRPWQFEDEFGVAVITDIDHIDLKEPVPGVMISLKLYGARMHSKRLQDLPIAHDASILPEQRPVMRNYCGNDLDTTGDLLAVATNPKDNILATREALSAEFGIDMRSKSDAQIAEAMIKITVEKRTGNKVYKPVVPAGTAYTYTAPSWVAFTSPVLQEMLAEVLDAQLIVQDSGKIDLPEALTRAIPLGYSTYTMGLGGLHSNEKATAHVATDTVLLRDRDVVSYYPSLILQCGLFPKNMGAHFQSVYQDFFTRRIAAKKAGNKSVAQTLKIVLNGSFGKLGSKYSVLYSPDLLIQVTITGQLAMLMLIEAMEANGIPCVSANTDGVVMACPVELESRMLRIVAEWERTTGLETEETCYRALYSRDVNNYLALKAEGGYKPKGVLVPGGPSKNPDYDIVGIAVCQFLDKGTPVAETILRCTDIRKFLRVRTANGGCKWGNQYLGRVARWYRAAGNTSHIEYVKNGNKVAGSDGACPLMELPDTLPADIDYGFYLAEVSDMLRELGVTEPLPVKPKRVTNPKVSSGVARGTDPGTSQLAAASFDAAAMEHVVLDAIAKFPDGCTSEQVTLALPGYSYQTISPRYAPLIRKGLVIDTGTTRVASSGRQQRVMRAASIPVDLF